MLVLLRCRLRATQNSISVQVALHFVTKLMVPKHETSPFSLLLPTYSNLKISLPLATIIPPISAFSTLCLPHNYSILFYNLLRKSVVSFSSVMNYGNTKSLEILCKQYYYVIADVVLSCWKRFLKLLRSYNLGKFLENCLC